MNKFDVVFGENAGAVKSWGDGFAAQVGRSERQVADFMAGTQDLLVPLGFESGAATDMSKEITGLSLDLASFNNMADEDTLRDLHAALTGSGEVMKKYGVIVSEAAVKQELLNQGINPKQVTEQQKVQARLNIIMRGTTAAQGDAIRSAGSFANQMKRLQGVVENVNGAIGGALLPLVTPLVTKLGDLAASASIWASENQGIIRTIAIVAAGLVAFGGVLVATGAAIVAVGAVLGGLATVVTTLGTVLGVVGVVITALASPLGIVIGLGLAAVAAFASFTETGQAAVEILGSGFGELKALVTESLGAIFAALQAGNFKLAGELAMNGLRQAWLIGLAKLKELWFAFANFYKRTLVENIAGAFLTAVGEIQKAWVNTRDFIVDAWVVVSNAIIGGVASILEALGRILPSAKKAAEGLRELQEDRNIGIGDRDQNRRNELAGIDAATSGAIGSLREGGDASERAGRAELDKELAALQAERAKLEQEFAGLKFEAETDLQASIESAKQENKTPLGDGKKPGSLSQVALSGPSLAGSQDAIAALNRARFGGGTDPALDLQKKQVELQQQQLDKTDDLVNEARNGPKLEVMTK